jgi:pimeloyl-ACP methyl ester carboxylesterase
MTFANALGLDRFGLVAHDVGAYVAQKIARLALEWVTDLFVSTALIAASVGPGWTQTM